MSCVKVVIILRASMFIDKQPADAFCTFRLECDARTIKRLNTMNWRRPIISSVQLSTFLLGVLVGWYLELIWSAIR